MTLLLPSRPARSSPPALGFAALPGGGALSLTRGRAHEACGLSRHMFALIVAGAQTRLDAGPVVWIHPGWEERRLNPPGFAHLLDPARLLLIAPRRTEDMLWSLEEVLRSGEVALAVADLTFLPGLTAVRRLHLAAEAGAAAGRLTPVSLLLTRPADPHAGGAPGVESRWHMQPAHAGGARSWQLALTRARSMPPGRWRVETGIDGASARRLVTGTPAAPPVTATAMATAPSHGPSPGADRAPA